MLHVVGYKDDDKDGIVLRALHSTGVPRFDSLTRHHIWVEFVVDSRSCSGEVFIWLVRFSSLYKEQHFQIPIQTGNSGWKRHSVEATEIPIYWFFLF